LTELAYMHICLRDLKSRSVLTYFMGALQSLQTFSSVMETNREYHAIGQEDIKCLPALVKIILVMAQA
jgi:hypothetical protein